MMVIQGTVSTTITNTNAFVSGDTRIFPADRCVWEQVDDTTGGYSIDNVAFVGLTHSTVGGTNVTGRYIQLTAAQLGYIGKSGRFVAISN